MPQCFQKPTFKIADAIKIIDYKYKMKLQQIENKKDFQEDEREPKGALEDEDDEIKPQAASPRGAGMKKGKYKK